MKRPSSHWLENESRVALRSFLPTSWIVKDNVPDYGIDFEVEIVEGEDVTNKVLWLQIKATEKIEQSHDIISYTIETKALKHYDACRLPVLILLWIKPQNRFYHIFAQRYIQENLNVKKPNWRAQKTISLQFPLDSKLKNANTLVSVATEGYFYIIRQQLIARTGGSTTYWLDGIPKSDDKELKERTLRALSSILAEKYDDAIAEYDVILKACTMSPVEKMAILIRSGDAHYFLGQNDEANKDYNASLQLSSKVSKEDALLGKASALGGIGLTLWNQGDLDNALVHCQEALKTIGDSGHKQEEAVFQNNIALVYWAKRSLDDALKFYRAALETSREIGYKRGEACILGNIGLVYMDKKDLDKALIYHQEALKINRERGGRREEALDLGNIGIIRRAKGNLDDALKAFEEILEIHRQGGYRQSEASTLGNIGLICRDKGNFDDALKYFFEALKINREIGYRAEEAISLGNIGRLYLEKGDPNNAFRYLTEALRVLDRYGLTRGRKSIQDAIDSIRRSKGNS